MRAVVRPLGLAVLSLLLHCAPDVSPDGVRRSDKTGGPEVIFDLSARPFPNVPFPNDILTVPDPSSRTGLRLNLSTSAPTRMERSLREGLNRLEGFGTFAPISIPFSKPLDVVDVKRRHNGDDFDFLDDAVYLVNIRPDSSRFGVPVPIDVGAENFPLTVPDPARFWPNDPQHAESNLLFETRDEDLNHNGLLDPGEDTDFDNVLDHPDFAGGVRPPNGVDDLMTFYESQTNTMILRPLVPLEEQSEYAVLVTDRLHGVDGIPIQSPFDFIHHPSQRVSAETLADALARHPEYFGFGGASGHSVLEHVQFLFTFTTQPTTADLLALRDGVYGIGRNAALATDYPAEVQLLKAVGSPVDPALSPKSSNACVEQGMSSPFIARTTPSMLGALRDVYTRVFGLSGPPLDEVISSFDDVEYVALGTLRVPWLLGDVRDVSADATFVGGATSELGSSSDTVPFLFVVPKATPLHRPPFPVTFYGHGFGRDATEALAFAGQTARHGVATVAMNAPGYGLDLSDTSRSTLHAIFSRACLSPLATALDRSRIRDIDGDGITTGESGADMMSGEVFHTRDMIRQALVERILMLRALRSFDGARRYDWTGNGAARLAGDFDGDGVVDLGGPFVHYSAWGETLGGILASIQGGIDPYVSAIAPISGGGGLGDLPLRSSDDSINDGVLLRWLGPLIVGVPADARIDHQQNLDGTSKLGPDGKPIPLPLEAQTRTGCEPGELTLRFVVPGGSHAREIEFACATKPEISGGMDVVVLNQATLERRCGRVVVSDQAGSIGFRVSIAVTTGDPLLVQTWRPPPDAIQAVDAYGDACHPISGAQLAFEVRDFEGLGSPGCGSKIGRCPVVLGDATGTLRAYPPGSSLVAIADGLGFRRQSPELRQLASLSALALEPADPISYAKYFLQAKLDPMGNAAPATASLDVQTVGDTSVPASMGVSLARARGAVPFLRSTNVAAKVYSDFVAPDDLVRLFAMTPNRVLLDNHVIEGIARLARHPAGAGCVPNAAGTLASCPPMTQFADDSCAQALFDIDDLSDGALPFAEQRLGTPLRLARIASHATDADTTATWQPRLAQPWTGRVPLAGMLLPYVEPRGARAIGPIDPCTVWDPDAYVVNTVAHFLANNGADIYVLSHPQDHRCAATVAPPMACMWGD